jgi:hypothetical protein
VTRAHRRLLLENIRHPRLPRWLWPSLLVVLAALLLWPYAGLWRLNQRVTSEPPSALEHSVDIQSVRDQIRRRLNKEANSDIGEVSDAFIGWIEQGIRRPGNETLQRTVTLEWLHGLLRERSTGEGGFLPAVRYAFYDPPDGFRVRIAADGTSPLHLRMEPTLFGWRVTAIYY